MSKNRTKSNRKKQLKERKKKMNSFAKRPRIAQQPIAPGILPGVTIDSLKDVTCMFCNEKVFLQAASLKIASPLQTQTSLPSVVAVPLGFMCAQCGQINPFDPKDPGRKATPEEIKAKESPSQDLDVKVNDGIATEDKPV